MRDHARPTLSNAQGWIFVIALAMPGMVLAAWPLIYTAALYLRLPPLLSAGQIGIISKLLFFVVLLSACIFNAWLVTTVEVAPAKRRRELVQLTLVFLVLQLAITPILSETFQRLLDLVGVF